MKSEINSVDIPFVECPVCGHTHLSKTIEVDTFEYGIQTDNPVVLSVKVPVFHCSECNQSFTGEDASILRHNAVCELKTS